MHGTKRLAQQGLRPSPTPQRPKPEPVTQTVDIDGLARQISDEWRKLVPGIINIGRLLIEAKQKVGHGNWMDFVRKLPFGDRTADCLMKIARHPILSDSKHVANLPPSWGTLHRLTELPDRELKRMLSDGRITCDLQRKDADKLIEQVRAGGLYRFERLAEAMNILVAFRNEYPDPKEIENVYDGYMSEGEHAVVLSDVAQLPAWLTKFYRVSMKVQADLERFSDKCEQAHRDEIVRSSSRKSRKVKA